MFVVQRSGDMFLGIPYDICLFTKIMLYVAAQTNTLPNKLDVSIIDAHIYTNHFDAVGKYIEQTNYKDDCSFTYESGNLVLHNYEPGPIIKAEVAV